MVYRCLTRLRRFLPCLIYLQLLYIPCKHSLARVVGTSTLRFWLWLFRSGCLGADKFISTTWGHLMSPYHCLILFLSQGASPGSRACFSSSNRIALSLGGTCIAKAVKMPDCELPVCNPAVTSCRSPKLVALAGRYESIHTTCSFENPETLLPTNRPSI